MNLNVFALFAIAALQTPAAPPVESPLIPAAPSSTPSAPPQASSKKEIQVRTYRFEMVAAANSKVPVIGKLKGATRTLGISRIAGTGDAQVHHLQVCDVKVESESRLVETRVPKAFVKALKPPIGKVIERAGLIEIDMGEEFVGFDPKFSKSWPPKDRKSPGVIDSDKDGLPGATMDLTIAINGTGLVKLLMTQRARSRLIGKRAKDGSISGGVKFDFLQQKMLGTSPQLFNLDEQWVPDDARSWFKLTPIAADANCLTK